MDIPNRQGAIGGVVTLGVRLTVNDGCGAAFAPGAGESLLPAGITIFWPVVDHGVRIAEAGLGHEHFIEGATYGSVTNVSIYYEGNDNENVYLGGTNVGTSTGNGSGGNYSNAGAETTTTQTVVNARLANYQYRDSSGWHWAVARVYDNSGGLWSVDPGSGNSLTVISGGCGAARPVAPQANVMPSNQAQVHQRLVAVARQVASRAHESNPTDILMTTSTRQRANSQLSGDKVNGDQQVYVVMLKGTFTPPQGMTKHKTGSAPAVHTMFALVDAATGEVTDWGISDLSQAALTRLGPVTALS